MDILLPLSDQTIFLWKDRIRGKKLKRKEKEI
jgi:hypothetical protein